MSTQKTIKSFVNDMSLFANDLTNAGFTLGEVNARGKKLDRTESHKQFFSFFVTGGLTGFYNISSKPADFLSVLFPNFKQHEVNELSSFLVFMAHLFTGVERSVDTVLDFTIEFDPSKFHMISNLFNITIEDGSFVIRANTLNKRYVRPLDVEFHDIMYSLKKAFKSNLTFYFEDIVKIDNSIVDKILNESVEDYFWRKNNNPVLNRISDTDYVRNLVKFSVRNMVKKKVPSFEARSQYTDMDMNKLRNKNYVVEVEDHFNKEHYISILFDYSDLRTMKPLFQSLIKEDDINLFFELIELYIFKMKIDCKIKQSDKIEIFRHHINKLDKDSLTTIKSIKLSILDFSIVFTDVIELNDNILNISDAPSLVSDNFETLYQTYRNLVIKDIEKLFGMPSTSINNNTLLVHQMALI